MRPKVQPMVMPPKAWRGYDGSPYLLHKAKIIRWTGTKQPARDFRSYDSSYVTKTMDILGSVAWGV